MLVYYSNLVGFKKITSSSDRVIFSDQFNQIYALIPSLSQYR